MADQRGRPLKVGVFIGLFTGFMDGRTMSWADVAAMARTAEEIGFDSVWLPDHFLIPTTPAPENDGQWDCGSMLAALAAVTSRVEIGTLVLATGFRNPTLIAKMADAVDEISGGRLLLGLRLGPHSTAFGEQALRNAGLRPNLVMRLPFQDAVKRLVETGRGIALMARIAAEREIATGHLVALNVEGFEFTLPLLLLRPQGRPASPAIETFGRFLRQHPRIRGAAPTVESVPRERALRRRCRRRGGGIGQRRAQGTPYG